jgi:hypothetical protein
MSLQKLHDDTKKDHTHSQSNDPKNKVSKIPWSDHLMFIFSRSINLIQKQKLFKKAKLNKKW